MRKVFLFIAFLSTIVSGAIAKPLADSRDIHLGVAAEEERIRSIQIAPAKASINDEGMVSLFFLKNVDPVSLKVEDSFGTIYESITASVVAGELIEMDLNMLEPGIYTLWIDGEGESWYGKFEIE